MVVTIFPSGDKKAIERTVGHAQEILGQSKTAQRRKAKQDQAKAAEEEAKVAAAARGPENGHHVIEQAINSSKQTWQQLNRAFSASDPANAGNATGGGELVVGFIADQDDASIEADGHTWDSYYSEAMLSWTSADGEEESGERSSRRAYSLGPLEEHKIAIQHAGDKNSGEGGRGAEFSALEMWQQELLTMDDRTGGVFAIGTVHTDADEELSWNVGKKISPLTEEPVVMLRGDGTEKGKGLKCEWATVKDGKMYVGSTGKERTNDDGTIAHMGEMWVKTIDADWNVEHFNWTENYNALRKVAQCQWGDDPNKGAGYMIHESVRWSDVHKR
jgi:soluble calcium-activated nucleotidase 1